MDSFLTSLIDKGGIPGLVAAIIFASFRFGSSHKSGNSEDQMAKALEKVTDELSELRLQLAGELATMKADILHLKERK